jgi:predicted component of viral defense system (DUF524 family)
MDELDNLGIKFKISNRDGGIEHQYWLNKISQDYKIKGYKVELEKSVGNGKAIDIVAQKNHDKIAIEIETGKSNTIENIRKCLKAGYDSVISIATNWEAFTKFKDDVQRHKFDRKIKILFSKNL